MVLCCVQRVTLVTLVLVGETLDWKLRWNGCRVANKRTKNEYFVNQTKDRAKDRTKNDYFVNQTKDRAKDRTKNDYFVNQTKDRKWLR